MEFLRSFIVRNDQIGFRVGFLDVQILLKPNPDWSSILFERSSLFPATSYEPPLQLYLFLLAQSRWLLRHFLLLQPLRDPHFGEGEEFH